MPSTTRRSASPHLLWGGLIWLSCLTACSDKDKPDSGLDGKVSPDQALVDAGRDARPDAPPAQLDLGPPDRSAADRAADMADLSQDLGGVDLTTDVGVPVVWGYISRSVLPVNDGKGDLRISLMKTVFPFPATSVGTTIIFGADLRKAGDRIQYEISSGAAAGNYSIKAWMDDNNNPWNPLVIAEMGDLTLSKNPDVKIGATPIRKDLTLDKVVGDPSPPALRGRITATVGPAIDGKGPLYVAIYSQVPPSGLVGSASILRNADLSSTFGSEAYYLAGLYPGKYYLRIFLDDDNSSGFLSTPNPNKNDMIHKSTIQVRVVAGATTTQDVVLDGLQL